jgi:hypothetical protein
MKMKIIRKHVVEHEGKVYHLGRVPRWDKRNEDYALPRKRVPTGLVARTWNAGGVLDQGDTPQCVGYAGWGFLAGGPVVNKPSFTPTDLYHWAQEKDEWPGEDYEGSSTLGMMQALKEKGFVTEYRWGLSLDVLVAWVLSTGPFVTGTDWFSDMFEPEDGFIRVSGSNAGGHEWRIIGANKGKKCPDGTKGAFRMVNSWGRSWGDSGRAWISFNDYEKLLSGGGDAATPTEVKHKGV